MRFRMRPLANSTWLEPSRQPSWHGQRICWLRLRTLNTWTRSRRSCRMRLMHFVRLGSSALKVQTMNEARQSRLHPVAAWWAVPLRLIVGYGFIAHGLAKLSRGPSSFAHTLDALGVPAPDVMAWATIFVELIGGFAVLIGAFVSVASIPLAVVLLVAMFTVHLPYGFSSIKLVAVTGAGPQFGPPGYEVALLYLASLAALVVGGSGPLSIDGLLAPRKQKRPG